MKNTKKLANRTELESNKISKVAVSRYGIFKRSIKGIGDLKVEHEKSTSAHSELMKVDGINYFHVRDKSKVGFSILYVLKNRDNLNGKFEEIEDWNSSVYGKAFIELTTEGGKKKFKKTMPDVSIQHIPCSYYGIFMEGHGDPVQLHFIIETEDESYAFFVFDDIVQARNFLPFIGAKVKLSIKMMYEK